MIVALFLLFLEKSVAAPDPSVGARISVAAAQELLVSPPLPSLENGGGQRVTPQVGYMTATTEGSELEGTANAYSFKGDLRGTSAGLGFTSPPHGRAGWFTMLVGSSMTGEISSRTTATGSEFSLRNMNSQVVSGAGGISYRFIGDSGSSIAMGYFLGPAFMSVSSSFEVIASGSSTATPYKLNPFIYGAYGGLQLKLRIDKILINPYALYFYDATEKCKNFDSGGEGISGLCKDNLSKTGAVDLASSFSGFGLFLGYRKVRINIYSKAIGTDDFNDIKITNYSISYSFGVDIL